MPRTRWGIVPVVVCVLALAGCGAAEEKDTTPQLTRAQADALVAQLERARLTAAAEDLVGTRAALAGFRGQVARLRRAGALSDATARSLRIGAARTLARAASDIAPPVQVQTQTTPAPAPPVTEPKRKGDRKGDKKKKGRGKKGDE
jgi:hypothetical protein